MAKQETLEQRAELTPREKEVYNVLLDQYKSILKKKGYDTPKIKNPTNRSKGSPHSAKYATIAKELREGCTVRSLLGKYDINPREVYLIHTIADRFGIPIRCLGNKEKLDEYFQTHTEPDFENKIH